MSAHKIIKKPFVAFLWRFEHGLMLVVCAALLLGGSYPNKAPKRISEAQANDAFCASVGGRREVRHYYKDATGKRRYISVDCETATHVYEGGLEKRSSLDSVQQALFAAELTGKQPAVVIYDTDGVEGDIEHRIRTAAKRAAVKYQKYHYENRNTHSITH